MELIDLKICLPNESSVFITDEALLPNFKKMLTQWVRIEFSRKWVYILWLWKSLDEGFLSKSLYEIFDKVFKVNSD